MSDTSEFQNPEHEDGPLVNAARRVERAGEKAGKKVHDAKEKVTHAWESARQIADDVQEKDVGELLDDVRSYVRRHPGKSILVSFGLGVLLSGMFRH